MQFNSLKEKCKYYQSLSNYFLMPNSYVLCHIDGRSFSKLIKNRFEKPFDDVFINMMNETAQYLCKEVQGAKLAYTQSDEITLVLSDLNNEGSGTFFFEGRLQKMCSIIASLATAKFNQLMMIHQMSQGKDLCDATLCQFDCKVWNVPSLNDAFAWMLFRQIDCIRNSKQQAAQTYVPHKVLLARDTDKQIEILKERTGIDWNLYPDDRKFGRLVTKQYEDRETLVKGEIIKFQRSVWKAEPSYLFSTPEGKEKIISTIKG